MDDFEEMGIIEDQLEQFIHINIMANISNKSEYSSEFFKIDIVDESDNAEIYWINFYSFQILSIIDSVENALEEAKKGIYNQNLIQYINSEGLKTFLYILSESLQNPRIYFLMEFDNIFSFDSGIFNQCENSKEINIKTLKYIRKFGNDSNSFYRSLYYSYFDFLITSYKFTDFITFLKGSEVSSFFTHMEIIMSINLTIIIKSLEFISNFTFPIDIRLCLYLIILIYKDFDLETIKLFRYIVAIHALKNEEFLNFHNFKQEDIQEIILGTNKEVISEFELNIIPLIFGVSLTIFNTKYVKTFKFEPTSFTFINLIMIELNSTIKSTLLLQKEKHFDIIYSCNDILGTLMEKENSFAFAKLTNKDSLISNEKSKANGTNKDTNIDLTAEEKNYPEIIINKLPQISSEEAFDNHKHKNLGFNDTLESLEEGKGQENPQKTENFNFNIDKKEKISLKETETKILDSNLNNPDKKTGKRDYVEKSEGKKENVKKSFYLNLTKLNLNKEEEKEEEEEKKSHSFRNMKISFIDDCEEIEHIEAETFQVNKLRRKTVTNSEFKRTNTIRKSSNDLTKRKKTQDANQLNNILREGRDTSLSLSRLNSQLSFPRNELETVIEEEKTITRPTKKRQNNLNSKECEIDSKKEEPKKHVISKFSFSKSNSNVENQDESIVKFSNGKSGNINKLNNENGNLNNSKEIVSSINNNLSIFIQEKSDNTLNSTHNFTESILIGDVKKNSISVKKYFQRLKEINHERPTIFLQSKNTKVICPMTNKIILLSQLTSIATQNEIDQIKKELNESIRCLCCFQ